MASDDDLLNDDEIQKLLAEAQGGGGAGPAGPSAGKGSAAGGASASSGGVPSEGGGATSRGELPTGDTEDAASRDGADSAGSAPGTPSEGASGSETPGGKADGAASDAAGQGSSPGDGNLLEVSDIEALIAGNNAADRSSSGQTNASSSSRTDQLLDAVDAGLDAAIAGNSRSSRNVASDLDGAEPFAFTEFDSPGGDSQQSFNMGALDDVELDLHIELGRAELLIDEVMSLREGAVVPLDKLAGDPVDILVNGRLLARGEVLVLNDNFCVRVAEIVAPDF